MTAIISYTIIFIFSSVVYLIISWYIFKNEIHVSNVYLLVFFTLLLRLSFISTTPIGSDDVYRYMWDGKIQANSINPYLYAPTDEHLNSFHSDLLPGALNFKEMKTIYFPLSQWLFFTGYKLSGESVWGYKFLLFLFEILTLAAIFLLTKKFKIDLKYSLLYALCPLSLFQFGIDAHLDGFGLPLLLFSLYFYFDNKKILSAILLGLSLSIKPVGLVIIPIFFLNEKNILDKLKIAVIPFIAFFVQFIPYIASTNPFEAFFIFTKNWYFNGFVFNILNTLFANNQTSRLICGILLVISLLPIYFSKKELIEKIYFALMLLMIFSPVVHPWYIAWIAILLPITKMRSGIYYVAAGSLTVFTILNYQLYGIWKDYWLVLIIEYVPLLFILFLEITKNFSFKRILPGSTN
ncbi:MAG: hypothetical protein NTX65_13470 [Ignavibacteriales bacterium]|nr:hypothetical protein [Ignavibacteriales bacterium]